MVGRVRRQRRQAMPELVLLAERPVRELLPGSGNERAEASGVLALDGRLLVIFDDSTAIAIIDEELSNTAANRVVFPEPKLAQDDFAGAGYEDIARDPASGLIYLLVESVRRGRRLLPRVEIIEPDFRRHSQAFLDFAVESDNKGMEGLTCVSRAGELTLVALCEGNRCRGGREGERPGGGRLQLFRPAAETYEHLATVRLPTQVPFIDYSSLAVRGDRIAVLSQQSSALWVGEFRSRTWEFVDHGTCYHLPRDDDGRIQYGTAEGVSWLDDDRVAIVSDRAARNASRWRAKHRSVHIFALP
jgi:hypothetical protein